MTVLTMDTSGPICSAAILRDGRILGERMAESLRNHSVQAMAMVEGLLANCALSLDQIDVFAAVLGPGSFTGIRIGVSTIKALAMAAGKPCVGVDALEALAAGLAGYEGVLCPIIDARAGQAYTAQFRGYPPERLTEDEAVRMDEALAHMAQTGARYVFVGDGVATLGARIRDALGDRAIFPPPHQLPLRASAACALAERRATQGQTTGYADLRPLYVKASQAEREEQERRSRG